ncbi:MAG: methyltransferase domain-containing protein [Firmicutes bacterium]|nr:methyltransferase domain-containing protein [Bacillota bacterium]
MLEEKLRNFEPPVDGNPLVEMARGYQESLLLYQAFKTRVFDALADGPKNAETVAREIGGVPERVVLVLDALVALGLVEKRGYTYTNSEVAQTFLSSRSKFYQGDLLDLQLSPDRRRRWENVIDWLKGEEVERNEKPDEVFNPSFIRAMAQAALGHKGFKETILAIANHSSFQSAQRLLDLGGGHGLYAIALKQLKPELEAIVFDLPHVEQVTQEYSRQYNTEVVFVGGDFYKDELPAEQDIVLAFDILYTVPAQAEKVWTKVYRALKPGSYLFTKHWLLDDTRTRPKRAVLAALDWGHFYSLQEMKEILTNIGYQIEGSTPVGDSTLFIARKEGTDASGASSGL